MPAVALLGPRQCGKATLAKAIIAERPDAVYLDLERESHLRRLQAGVRVGRIGDVLEDPERRG